MQLPYFYEPLISISSLIVLSEETSKHCVQVLRMKEKDKMHLTDGKGNLFTAEIIEAHKKHCQVKIIDSISSPASSRKTCIAISILKNNSRFEWFLEKAAELGISEIIPLICERTEKTSFRWDRMNHILVSAMLQSRQSFLCKLHQPTFLSDVIQSSTHEQKLVAHCEQSEKVSINSLSSFKDVQMLIGPEGDFSTNEIQLAIENNYQAVSLGDTRLRTETAGITAAVLLMNH